MSFPPFPPEFPGPDRPGREPGPGTWLAPGPGAPGVPRLPGLPGFPGPPGDGSGGERSPAEERLFEHRIILAHGRLDDARAAELSAGLMALDAMGDGPITLHLRTHDGDLDAAFAVADTIGTIASPVHAVVAAEVGGPPVLVLAVSDRREMTPHAVLRLSEPEAHYDGPATDVAAHEREYRRRVDAFYIRLAETTGREVDELREDARAGRMLTADDAVAYGLVDAVPGPS